MARVPTSTIIHGFALLHAATAIACRMAGIGDELMLTTLTVILTTFLCIRYGQSVEFSSIVLIIANILGYALGTGIAALVRLAMDHPLASPAIATFLTTELMGWGLVVFMNRFAVRKQVDRTGLSWLMAAVAVILGIRIVMSLFSSSLFGEGSFLEAVSAYMGNPIMLLSLTGLTILFMEHAKRVNAEGTRRITVLGMGTFVLAISALSALIVELTSGSGNPFSWERFLELSSVALIAEALIYSVIYMVEYAIDARRNADREKDRADLAKFQYLNLKQQLNPHFLFNSLNILDALVLDGKPDEASTYIHKLSGIYRYMLKNEDAATVPLHDEMTYVGMYTDLLKVRFQDGFSVEADIRDEDLGRHVVPCSVQLLIENATKHNSIQPGAPLCVRISSDGEYVTVSNNLNPRLTPSQSTGMGLSYIKRQYGGRSGKEVAIHKTGTNYTVKLPLL